MASPTKDPDGVRSHKLKNQENSNPNLSNCCSISMKSAKKCVSENQNPNPIPIQNQNQKPCFVSPKKRMKERKVVAAKKKQLKRQDSDFIRDCKCKDKVKNGECFRVDYENLRASLEEFFKSKGVDNIEIEIEVPILTNGNVDDDCKVAESPKGIGISPTIRRRRDADTVLEEARQSVPETGSGRVLHLVKAFEKLFSIMPKEQKQKQEPQSDSHNSNELALPELQPQPRPRIQPPPPPRAPQTGELIFNAQSLGGVDAKVSSSLHSSRSKSTTFDLPQMEQQSIQQPLIPGGKWSNSYEYLGSSVIPSLSSSMGDAELSVDEIRTAASNSGHYNYPPSLHAPLISSPESHSYPPSEQAVIEQQNGYGRDFGGNANVLQRQVFDEVEIRELLIDHVGHRCCWGSRPARTWKIQMVEDCNVYVGNLDSFIEEREIIKERVPYDGSKIDGKDSGPELGVWELDLRSQFPVLFVPEKETRIKIPHSEAIEKCPGCDGRGNTLCSTCNADQEPGYYKANQMTPCASCHGRGLIAHRDGSDTICKQCNGEGKIPCATCSSSGLIKCQICQGSGSLVARSIAIIKWKTLSTRKVSATKGAGSVPDDVFHRAKGVQLCNMQAHQCTPAFFADSYFLNMFSSEVIADRAPVPPTARVICERHTISVVPVTRVTMSHSNRSFNFYIIGFGREVYLKDRYPAQFCWGLCPCLEWLNI